MTTRNTTGQDTVIAEIHISAPPDRARFPSSFTDPSCPVKSWQMDSRLGGAYRYLTEKGAAMINGVDEFECHGEILEIDPPRLLVYTWYGNWHDNKSLRTVVRWELSPIAGGTHVKVTHSGLAQEATARKDYSGGWPGVLAMLKKFTEN